MGDRRHRASAGTSSAQALRRRSGDLLDVISACTNRIITEAGHHCDLQQRYALRKAIIAAVEYLLLNLEHRCEPCYVPFEIIHHARCAARENISLGTVLRCCTAGCVALHNLALDEFAQTHAELGALHEVQTTVGLLLQAITDLVTEEYKSQLDRTTSHEEQRTVDVRRLLAGDVVASGALGYELDAWHVGVIAAGSNVRSALSRVTPGLECSLLLAPNDDGSAWLWLGSARKQVVARDVQRWLDAVWPADVSFAIGEPAAGVAGWRLTHWQAERALLISFRRPRTVTRYVDVALVAPWIAHEQSAKWLIDAYLSPLDKQRGSGEKLRETLREYFASGQNSSAAASALKVSRRTMRNRMATIERALATTLTERRAELELALRLERLIAQSK
jgi:PucR C-terminal helix-turn-helix domain/GGDEF-like domain